MYQPSQLPPELAAVLATVRGWSGPDRQHPPTAVERADWVAGLRQLIDAAQAAFVGFVGDFDALGDAQTLNGSASTASWLRSATGLGMAAGDAAQQVRIARNARGLLAGPMEALACGELVFDQVRAIDNTVHSLLDPATATDAVTVLTDLGRRSDTTAVRRAGQQIRFVVDADRAARSAEADFARRRLHLSPLLDGMAHLDGIVDAEAATVLTQAFAPFLTPSGAGDLRSTAQRRADGLLQLVQAGVAAGAAGQHPGAPTNLSVIVDMETLIRPDRASSGQPNRPGLAAPTGLAAATGPAAPTGPAGGAIGRAGQPARLAEHPAGGWLIPDATLRRLACDPVLTTLLAGGTVPLQLGRTRRLFDRHQLTALALRDLGCRWPGCTRPPAHTEGHHLVPWAEGGPTDIDNGLLLCRWHHRLAHEGHWAITADDHTAGTNSRLWFQPPCQAPPHPSDPRGP